MIDSGRILVVDDEESFLVSTTALLCRDGYTCEPVRDGCQAAGLLHQRRYDAMVADIRMAGNEKLELVREARTAAPGMPVILVTGNPSVETAIDSVSLPVIAYLKKPLDYPELRGYIETAMAHSRMRQTLAEVASYVRECERELEKQYRTTAGDKAGPGPVSNLLISTLATCLSELLRLRAAAQPAEPQPKLCQLLDCPMYPSHREAILDAIEVLKRTKSSFKSKELGELRMRLEGIVD
jgi:DNA-binding response OmpR family regulator